ncbi:MAG: hypothetical protein MJE77_15030 [Proteobacteria bacterium]|nr:hypothetical protein [Pseudomonadota bacterium]
MAFRNLTAETMATISERWLDPERDREILAKLSVLAPLLPLIEERHQALISGQHIGSAMKAEIETVRTKQQTLDVKHDRKIRGTHYMLTGLAELADDADQAAAFLDLRDRLLPEGRSATNRSYVDQAGDALRLPGRLDESDRKQLDQVPTPWGNLGNEVDAWTEAATEIGQLEEQRIELERNADSDAVTPAQARQAMNNWIRIARAVENNLDVAPGATDEIRDRILGPLYRAEERADRKRAAGDDNDPDPPDDPTGNGPS